MQHRSQGLADFFRNDGRERSCLAAETPSGPRFYRRSGGSPRFVSGNYFMERNRNSNCYNLFRLPLRSNLTLQNPLQQLVEGPEHTDSHFAFQFAMDFEHSGEAELKIVFHQKCAPRVG
jgi:hypothetical protein